MLVLALAMALPLEGPFAFFSGEGPPHGALLLGASPPSLALSSLLSSPWRSQGRPGGSCSPPRTSWGASPLASVFSISSVAVWNWQEPLGNPAPTRLGLSCEEERGF